ncbi:hypothetical protein [Parageobacillus thermoglucosidasius]|uniref:hypothetical protein n=1 Tax=Parageobacillus thermoglucosidasius TaxID=1426 RepID=UPI000E1753AB|nr:hypothetical protein [Parageobacillus thermoglucosidasius]MED4904125.1 hypothetical protein [Parageobacillus thermoglucosidasius]MED4915675.1 hypothetical protein [Parageobacillus thermoglucosidasius]MED4945060.1 hypothetical protein [Parageobacillus thermoglucosidasius]MED4983743.1 hypothetical protein [Parageobacillus thermoglucosidasius]RDE19318.1 hypothetical protein DV714_19985 [Parageobacillus thermoglucosidasius]
MRKFEFGKSYEEVEINGKPYKIDLSDDKLKEYQRKFQQFFNEAQDLQKADVEKMSLEDQEALLEKIRKIMKVITDSMLGEGTFDELFELAGRSTWNYMNLIYFLIETVNTKFEAVKEEKRKQYVKKGK